MVKNWSCSTTCYTSKRTVKKTVEAAGNLIENKIADITTRSTPRTLVPNTLETVPNKTENIGFDAKIPKERYISPEKGSNLLMSLN